MEIKNFNVVDYNSGSKKFVSYDVIPFFVEEYITSEIQEWVS